MGLPRRVRDLKTGHSVTTIEGRVEAPTVAQALAVLEASDADASDADALETLQDVARAWLPAPMHRRVLALSPASLAQFLITAVCQTAMPPSGNAAGPVPDDDDDDDDEAHWDRTVLDVARAYSWTVAETRGMAWPDFVEAARALPSLRARDTLRAAEAALAPHMDEKGRTALFDRLVAEATGKTPDTAAAVLPPWEQAGMSREDYTAQQRALALVAVEAMQNLRREAAQASAAQASAAQAAAQASSTSPCPVPDSPVPDPHRASTGRND